MFRNIKLILTNLSIFLPTVFLLVKRFFELFYQLLPSTYTFHIKSIQAHSSSLYSFLHPHSYTPTHIRTKEALVPSLVPFSFHIGEFQPFHISSLQIEALFSFLSSQIYFLPFFPSLKPKTTKTFLRGFSPQHFLFPSKPFLAAIFFLFPNFII